MIRATRLRLSHIAASAMALAPSATVLGQNNTVSDGTAGGVFVVPLVVNGLNKLSTGKISVHSEVTPAGGNKVSDQLIQHDGQFVKQLAAMNVSYKDAKGNVNTVAGVGATDPKFDPDFKPESHNVASNTHVGAFPNDLNASAASQFSASKVNMGGNLVISSNLRVAGYVTLNGKGTGLAAAQAVDPFTYNFSSPGKLPLDAGIGTTDVVTNPITGQPIPSLQLIANRPDGFAHFDTETSLTGVMFDGSPVDGELYRLDVDANGVVLSPSKLDVTFIPSPVLGLTTLQIDGVEQFVESRLSFLPDGTIGLAPGSTITLFGPGGALPELDFTFNAGTVTVGDSASAFAIAGVPEPGPPVAILALCAAAPITVGCRRARTRA